MSFSGELGDYVPVYIYKKIHLHAGTHGGLEALHPGTVVYSDSYRVKASGKEFDFAQIRSIIHNGWAGFKPMSFNPQAPQQAPVETKRFPMSEDNRSVRSATGDPSKPDNSKARVAAISNNLSSDSGEVVARIGSPVKTQFVASDTMPTPGRKPPNVEHLLPRSITHDSQLAYDYNHPPQSERTVTAAVYEEAPAPQAAPVELPRIALAKAVRPDFEWDMKRQWRSRVKAALEHKNDPVLLLCIYAVEIDSVQKEIAKHIVSAA